MHTYIHAYMHTCIRTYSLGGGPPASAVDPFILRRNEQK